MNLKISLICLLMFGSIAVEAHPCSECSTDPTHWIFSVPFQRIEAGSFTMGSPLSEEGRDDDENQVRVEISSPLR